MVVSLTGAERLGDRGEARCRLRVVACSALYPELSTISFMRGGKWGGRPLRFAHGDCLVWICMLEGVWRAQHFAVLQI